MIQIVIDGENADDVKRQIAGMFTVQCECCRKIGPGARVDATTVELAKEDLDKVTEALKEKFGNVEAFRIIPRTDEDEEPPPEAA